MIVMPSRRRSHRRRAPIARDRELAPMRPKRPHALRPIVDRLDDRCLLSGFSPQQLQTAYGLQTLTFDVNGSAFPATGIGQTIAIIDVFHDPYLYSDLHTFDATNGL